MSENKTNNHIKIGVLAVQGAFAEHRTSLEKLGVETFEIRQLRDLDQDFDGLILPGGESTVQGKLLQELGLFEPLRERIESGLPTFGTCAGGRQLGSFYTEENFDGIGKIPMTFIRAPLIQRASQDVQILATVQNQIVAVRYKNQLAISFHPELNSDLRVHQYFVEKIVKANQQQVNKAA